LVSKNVKCSDNNNDCGKIQKEIDDALERFRKLTIGSDDQYKQVEHYVLSG